MSIFVNRVLNMRQIQAIGLDMDFTLVRYKNRQIEYLTYREMVKKLVELKGYSPELKNYSFTPENVIRGLILDKELGNLLKVSLHGKIKTSYHGLEEIDFKHQQKIYQGQYVDLNDPRFSSIDTIFSTAYAVLFSQIIDLKKRSPQTVSENYPTIEKDLLEALDISHQDGTIKDEIEQNLEDYIVQDQETVTVLERFKKAGKKLWLITNSDYSYTRLLLNFTINPFLKDFKSWQDLFDLTITSARKPRFFTDRVPFLEIQEGKEKDFLLKNYKGDLGKGVFQGGSAEVLQMKTGLSGDEILYLGDHIYGDILALKKACNWRTALVVEELSDEIQALKSSREVATSIDLKMRQKEDLESQLDQLYIKKLSGQEKSTDRSKAREAIDEISRLNVDLGELIQSYRRFFNENWGEVMRAGQEPSRLAGQIEKYACIYMSKISDFITESPRAYFRPEKRPLPHEPLFQATTREG